MTKDEALKMAIEYIEKSQYEKRDEVINACKEALEQPAQEPVAWMGFDEIGNADFLGFNDFNKYTTKQTTVLKKPIPLYTHPHQWQGLTDDEIDKIYADTEPDSKMDTYYMILSRAIEAKLKEKNHVN